MATGTNLSEFEKDEITVLKETENFWEKFRSPKDAVKTLSAIS